MIVYTTMTAIQGEKMNTILTKFIICSLPRTGTKSVSKMMQQLGFGISHAPGPAFESFLTTRQDVKVMADTPCYQPSVVQAIVGRSDETKFIYIDKTAREWVDSMVKVNLIQGYLSSVDTVKRGVASPHNQTDYDAMREVLESDEFNLEDAHAAFIKHKARIETIVPEGRLLVYNFAQGWEPLCNFVGKPVPASEIPHLNKDTMFDQIN